MTEQRKQELSDLTMRAMRCGIGGYEIGFYLRLILAAELQKGINDAEVLALHREISVAVVRAAGVPEPQIAEMLARSQEAATRSFQRVSKSLN